MEDEISGIYDDDGNKINPDLIPKPALCMSCKKDDEPGEEDLKCGAYEAKDEDD